MKNAYKNLRECVLTNPGGLSFLPKKVRNLALSYIPYSTGIEIECGYKSLLGYSASLGNSVGKINLLNYDLTNYEQTFRLRQGEKGLLELEKITDILKEYFLLNPGSGIHYHIDMTDIQELINWDEMQWTTGEWSRAGEFEWILKELDTWEYTGKYNKRMIGTSKNAWIRMCSLYKTMEFRIGEMTFDYQLIVKRILHCQSIVKRFKKQIIAKGVGTIRIQETSDGISF